jgi:hypothetical protein
MSDPAFIMMRNMTQASSLRSAVRRELARRVLIRDDLNLDVIYDMMPPRLPDIDPREIRYGFNLRVWRNSKKPPKLMLSLWGETREELLSTTNMLTLFLIYRA